MLKYLIVILITSFVFTEPAKIENVNRPNVKPDIIKISEEEDIRIKNPELRKELLKLREEFNLQNQDIEKTFRNKIKPLKIARDNEIAKLKDEFLNKRKALFEKHRKEEARPLKKKKEKEKYKSYKTEPKLKGVPKKKKKNK